ncbi:MAG: hypothetical protein IPH18_12075 [Chitinophagaceae bacterium]|nr:hypothetical protein [Chitinophagaceae bacterium]
MHIEVREQKTRETNYLDMTGTATGEIESGSAGFEAAGSLVFSIYERGKMDTRWNISAVFTGTVTQENGLQKVAGTIVMKMKNSSTTASFSGNGAALDIPYNLSYRLGYDYDAADRVAFPLAMQVEYTDDNYMVKNAALVKVYVPGASMEYSYADKGANQGGYSYQTQDPNDRGSVFGKSYNINLFEGSPGLISSLKK